MANFITSNIELETDFTTTNDPEPKRIVRLNPGRRGIATNDPFLQNSFEIYIYYLNLPASQEQQCNPV